MWLWETLVLLGPPFAERAGELGLADAELRYDGTPLSASALSSGSHRDPSVV